jgi:Na+/proline symporter
VWTFFASSLGAWMLVTPTRTAASSGLLGLCMYAAGCGASIVLIAALSSVVQRRLPYIRSSPEVVGWRFGPLAKLYVSALVLLNTIVATMVEFSILAMLLEKYAAASIGYPATLLIGRIGRPA